MPLSLLLPRLTLFQNQRLLLILKWCSQKLPEGKGGGEGRRNTRQLGGRPEPHAGPQQGLDLKLLPPDLSRLWKSAACMVFVSNASPATELLCQILPSYLELPVLNILPFPHTLWSVLVQLSRIQARTYPFCGQELQAYGHATASSPAQHS